MKFMNVLLLFSLFIIFSLFNFSNSYGQVTSIILPTSGNESSFDVYNSGNISLLHVDGNGKIGLNKAVPRAQLEVGGQNGLLCTGTINSGDVSALGAGLRLQWYPRKGAFRVGMAETNFWDDNGTAITNMALYSIAMGYMPRATGTASVSIGAYNRSTADYALSLGSYSQATATHAIAIGTQAYASGIYSIALGSGADTNGKDGAVVIGDDSYFITAYASRDNEMTMRFAGGYRLYSDADQLKGVYMTAGVSGWTNYCDRNKKENFETLNSELILSKIKGIPITKWNYKKSDASIKYIGPMAQDFYAAFKLNGTDSLGINSICIDGVNMAAIKALIIRTDELKTALEQLKLQTSKADKLEKTLTLQSEEIASLRQEFMEMKKQMNAFTSGNNQGEVHLLTAK